MADTLRLPEKMRIRLLGLYQAQQEAIAKLPETHAYGGALTLAIDMFGLDIKDRHNINLDTGIVTPATAPTPLRKEPEPAEASS